jgi:hypothetical protein
MLAEDPMPFKHSWLNRKRKHMIFALGAFVLASSVFKMSGGSTNAADNAQLGYQRGYIVGGGWACDSEAGALMRLRTNLGAPGCIPVKDDVEIDVLESRSVTYLVRSRSNGHKWWITLNDLAYENPGNGK